MSVANLAIPQGGAACLVQGWMSIYETSAAGIRLYEFLNACREKPLCLLSAKSTRLNRTLQYRICFGNNKIAW
jgi:hypothetical protein